MTSSPDQIREQIEETRTNLSEDVNSLADTVNPAQAAKRKAASARSAVVGVKDKVMGTASESVSSTRSAGRHSRTPFGVTTMGRLIRIGCAIMASRSASSVRSGSDSPNS